MRAILRFWPDIRERLWVYGVIIFLSLFANGLQLVVPLLTGRIIDGPIAHHDPAGLVVPVLVICGLGVLEAAALFGRRYLAAPVTSFWEVLWRGRLYDKLQYVQVATHDAWDSGQLLSRGVQDLSQMRRFFAFGAPFLLVNPVIIVAGAIILTVMQPLFGLIFLVMAVPTVAIVAVFERKYRLAARAAQDQMGAITTNVEESIQGIRIIRAFGRTPWIRGRFRELSGGLARLEVRKARLDSWLWGTLMMLPTIAQAAIVGLGAWGVVHGWMSVGTVVAAVTVTMILRIPIEMFGFLLSDALMAATAAARYWEVMDLPLGITDTSGDVADDPAPVLDPAGVRGELRFEHVGFRFADADTPLLDGLDLTVQPGETLAIVGATGSGKSTLAALVPRLADVTSGRLSIDGTDVRELPLTELRRLVSVAFEDPILFSSSVRDNVALGVPHATDAEVRRALDIAQAADFVAALPEGLDTQVGEQGLALSGGQRQRLALARAILGTPRILVLDDPLSAVDVDTEDRVQRRLREVLPDSTTLVIAHRPSTAALADRVAVLHGGGIAALGTHEELLETSTMYRDLMGAHV